jgi:hypothetical protein
MATLNLPYLFNLMNDCMCHDLKWPIIPTNPPSKIMKFKGKNGEDPGDQVMTFHLWSLRITLMMVPFD